MSAQYGIPTAGCKGWKLLPVRNHRLYNEFPHRGGYIPILSVMHRRQESRYAEYCTSSGHIRYLSHRGVHYTDPSLSETSPSFSVPDDSIPLRQAPPNGGKQDSPHPRDDYRTQSTMKPVPPSATKRIQVSSSSGPVRTDKHLSAYCYRNK